MGAAKLLLPAGSRTLLEIVLERWRAAHVTAVVVVVPSPAEAPQLCRELVARVTALGAEAVVPENPPPEMKDSVALGLEFVAAKYAPRPSDAWLLAPADIPDWPSEIVGRLLVRLHQGSEPIAVPTFQNRRGHPVAFRWSLAEKVGRLPSGQGINALLHQEPVAELPCDTPAILQDVDTWDDYRRLVDKNKTS
ncbi:MAG: hypothetical protein KatS3mg110_1904 [Pirellulaceae bacterium]|nr:MAG: hypothetical protein KatS3mg110_1904 [Pirellulaceae bacterium]